MAEGALGGPINPDDERPRKASGRSLKEFFSELSDEHDFHFLIGGGTISMMNWMRMASQPTQPTTLVICLMMVVKSLADMQDCLSSIWRIHPFC